MNNPLFASLDVNARMQDGEAGRHLWAECVKTGVDARKEIIKRCRLLKPFIPPVVRGKNWEEYDTEEIANSIEFFEFKPGEKWHSFDGYGEKQYFVDPNKFMLKFPGFAPEIQGVYLEKENGLVKGYGYVLDKKK